MRRKLLSVLLVPMLVISLAACSSGGVSDSKKSDDTGSQEGVEKTASTETVAEETTDVAITETLSKETQSKEVIDFPETLANGEAVELTFAWWGSQTRHDRTQQVVELFMEKYPNVTINIEQYDFAGYFQKLVTLVGAGDVWDVFQLGGNLDEYQSILVDLQPYIEDGTINTEYITESMLNTTKYANRQVSLSLGTNTHCIVYNADMLEEAGLEEPTDNWTWDDYEEYSNILKEVTGEFGSSGLEEFNMTCWVGIPQMQAGLNFFKSDNSGVELTDASLMVPFLEKLKNMTDAGVYPDPGTLNETNTSVEQNLVATGEAAMGWVLSNQVVSLSNAASQNGYNNIKIANIPRVTEDGPGGVAVKSALGLSVSSNCQYPEVAAEFINFFINSNEANKILLGERGVSISSSVREALTEHLTETDQMIYDYIGKISGYKDSLDVNLSEPACQTEVKDYMKIEYEKMINGSQDPQTTAENILKFAEEAFK